MTNNEMQLINLIFDGYGVQITTDSHYNRSWIRNRNGSSGFGEWKEISKT